MTTTTTTHDDEHQGAEPIIRQPVVWPDGKPRKLRNGRWGAVISTPSPRDVRDGDIVHVRTRTDREWDAVVWRIRWVGDDSAIVETLSTRAAVAEGWTPPAWLDVDA